MADDDLEAIRAKRLAELQAQYGGNDPREAQAQAEREGAQRAREAEMKNSILTQILEQDARARLNSIALVKPEKAKMIEGMLIRMAQTGQLSGKLHESDLVKLLEQINQPKKTTIKFDRRKRADDSDEDF